MRYHQIRTDQAQSFYINELPIDTHDGNHLDKSEWAFVYECSLSTYP